MEKIILKNCNEYSNNHQKSTQKITFLDPATKRIKHSRHHNI